MRIWILCLALLCPPWLAANPLPDTIDRVRGAVVAIGSYKKTASPPANFRGTGFAVADGNLVVTNAHVLPSSLDHEHFEYLAVFSGQGEKARVRRATVVAEDPLHDLVVLRVTGPPLPAFRLGKDSSAREGQEIAFTGYPLGMVLGLHAVTHRGIISSITPIAIPQNNARQLTARLIKAMRHPYKVLQLDATAYPGNSGSPVYDQATGELLGVINSVLIKGSKESALSTPTGITYAIPLKFLRPLLAEAKKK